MDDKYSNGGGAAAASSSAVVDESLAGSGMRAADTLLRLVPMGLCVAALVVMLKNSQTDDYGSVAYSDIGAFKYAKKEKIPSVFFFEFVEFFDGVLSDLKWVF